jgi:hypothetical protein
VGEGLSMIEAAEPFDDNGPDHRHAVLCISGLSSISVTLPFSMRRPYSFGLPQAPVRLDPLHRRISGLFFSMEIQYPLEVDIIDVEDR